MKVCRKLPQEAKSGGLAVVVWSYPSWWGIDLRRERRPLTWCAMPPRSQPNWERTSSRSKCRRIIFNKRKPRRSMKPRTFPSVPRLERIRHVVQSAFNGRRIVIFSGGAKGTDKAIFDEVRAIRDGGGFGSIIGRNSFQRPKPDAVTFLDACMKIYAGEVT